VTKAILVRGVSPSLLAAIKRAAKKNRRTINAEVLTWLEERVKEKS
jgi:hypothetical protein